MAEAASTQVRDAVSETRLTTSQNVSRYSRVCPAPNHASPRFGDHRSEANVQAVYAAKRQSATVLHRGISVTLNALVTETISISMATMSATGAHSLTT